MTPFIAEIASQTLIINLPDKAKTYQKGSEQVKQFVLENEKQFVDTLKETSHAITDEQARTCWMNTRSALWILICLACLFSVIYTGYQAIQKENHRPVDIILCASMSALTMAAAIKAYTTCTHDRFSWTNFGSQFISIFKDKEIDNEARSYFAKFRHTPNNKSVNGVNYQEENESGNKLSDPQVDSINTENNKDDLYLERTIQSKKSSAAV